MFYPGMMLIVVKRIYALTTNFDAISGCIQTKCTIIPPDCAIFVIGTDDKSRHSKIFFLLYGHCAEVFEMVTYNMIKHFKKA